MQQSSCLPQKNVPALRSLGTGQALAAAVIRDIFHRRAAVDRLSSAVIVSDLVDLPEGLWSEWRGPRGDRLPCKLSQGGLALMLAPFGIRPRTIWPPRRSTADKSVKGYCRAMFEAAWASYCDEGGTPSHGSNVRYLHDREA
jgi:hypothetical protein